MRILITGGAGFIGSALVRHLITATDHAVLNVDKLTYAASPQSLGNVSESPRYSFRALDVCDEVDLANAFRDFRPDSVIHLAAETHVDRSIDGPDVFIATNVLGTLRILEATRLYCRRLNNFEQGAFRLLHVSTDEVFGALQHETLPLQEGANYDPRSPYAASKAGGDHLVRAWRHTYGLPTLVTHSTNNFGPYQFPEKLIPLTIIKALLGQEIPVYGRGKNMRDWLHVEDHVAALMAVLSRGRVGETYFIGARAERKNLDVVLSIAELVDELTEPLPKGVRRTDLVSFVPDRPGHDFRYALDPSKIERDTGWRPGRSFEQGLRDTVAWFIDNEWWWLPMRKRYGGERLGAFSASA